MSSSSDVCESRALTRAQTGCQLHQDGLNGRFDLLFCQRGLFTIECQSQSQASVRYADNHFSALAGLRSVNIKQLHITKQAADRSDPASLTKQFEVSMDRLGMDYVDIYMMHRDNEQVPVGEFVDAMHAQAAAGRIKVFGGSNWSFARVQAANDYAKKNGKQAFGVVSNNFSLARMIEPPWNGCVAASNPEYRQWLIENKMTLMPWSSQARGFFLDDTSPEFTADPERARCWFSEDNFERLNRARALAKKYNVRAINIALAYVLSQKFPTFPLIGPRTVMETRTSMPGLNVVLTNAEVSWLNLES